MEITGNGLFLLIKILGHFSFGGNFADDQECFVKFRSSERSPALYPKVTYCKTR